MKNIPILCILLFSLLISCSKEYEPEITPVPEGAIANAGIIADYPLWNPPATAIHIDPENAKDPDEDGTVAHPFNSFDDITWKDNGVYAIKRGTTLTSGMIQIMANKVTICSYGTGERPIINCNEVSMSGYNRYAINANWAGKSGNTICDLEISAASATSCLNFGDSRSDIKIINCKLYGSGWGIRFIDNQNIFIFNTEIYDIDVDGMFLENCSSIEISHCYVHNVNKNWKPPHTSEAEAEGDGIQFTGCNNWHVHHNIIDRTSSGNKFCFISNNASQDNGTVEFNILTGPKVDGSSLYFHNGKNIVVRYNHIKGPSESPLYSYATGMEVYGNVFEKTTGAVFILGSARVFNNVFYKMPMAIQGAKVSASNNVYDLNDNATFLRVTDLSGSNNLFVNGTPETGSFKGLPKFVDADNGDFHILAGSDCIDKGINMGLSRDMDSTIIPQGGVPDIGAFEYNGK